LLDGEKMAVLCREFDVSRQTGYKIYARYKDCGLEGLTISEVRNQLHTKRTVRLAEADSQPVAWAFASPLLAF
jgi:transposase